MDFDKVLKGIVGIRETLGNLFGIGMFGLAQAVECVFGRDSFVTTQILVDEDSRELQQSQRTTEYHRELKGSVASKHSSVAV